jgi:Reverse transcriptase (RNA-dependent DNA polymerase)
MPQTALGTQMGAHINNIQQQQKSTTNFQATRSSKLNIFIQNAHSIRGKVDELRLASTSCPFEIIILTETWLNKTISLEEHFSARYNVHRCDRTMLTSDRKDGGGVLIAIDTAFHSERVHIEDGERLEHVCVKVTIGSSNIFLFAVYIRSVQETEKFMLFADIVKKIPYSENDSVIVCGDFNQPGINWIKADDGDYFLPMNITSESEIAVCDTMLDSGMHQMCNLVNRAGNVLDLVFTNKFYELTLFESTRPLLELDQWHKAIEIELEIENIEIPASSESHRTYAFHLANFDAMNDFFVNNENLLNIGDSNNTDEAFCTLYAVLHDAVEKFVPKKITQRNNDPPWYNKNLKHLKNIKSKEYKKCKSSGNFDSYNAATDDFMKLQSELFGAYISRIQNELLSDSKYFWRFVNDRRKRDSIPAVVEFNGDTASDDAMKAMLFAEFFQQQYTQAENIDLNEILSECDDDAFEFQIEEDDVHKALQSINVNKGEGPDGISPKMMRNCSIALVKPLTVLFRKSFVDGYVPASLKNSRIVPIFKSGAKSNVTNYRAIAIIPTIAKVFELVVFNKIHDFVHEKISQQQHGFVTGRSTATNLLEMVNYTMDGMIAKCQTDVLYTDYAKAFDKMKHKRVLQKMAKIGFGKRLVKWFHAYLTYRKQFVQIGQMRSNSFVVASGVPAGSILGPCLFNIFINDIVDYVTNASVLLFADDLKLMRRITSPIDALVFQRAIDQLQEWCELNSLHLNIKKCYVMTYARVNNADHYEYTFNNGQHTFQRVQQHRDLGVIFDSKLTFEM